MRQYNITKNGKDYYIAEGLPRSVFEPEKRKTFGSEETLLQYVDANVKPDKKIGINLDGSTIDLEGRLKALRPKAVISKVEFRRGGPGEFAE